MQWNYWNEEEGELSAQERLLAIAAFKISTNLPLTEQENAVQCCGLPLSETITLQKLVGLLNYWQQLSATLLPPSEPAPIVSAPSVSLAQSPIDPTPYFYEGNPLPSPRTPAKAKVGKPYDARRNGYGAHR